MTGGGALPAALRVAALGLLVVSAWFAPGCSRSEPTPAAEPVAAPPAAIEPSGATGDDSVDITPLRRQAVTVYFPSADQDGLVGVSDR